MHRRTLVILAIPAAAAAMTVAGPALAAGGAHAAATHCVTVRIAHRRVRECLIPGPAGPRGVPGANGKRGATGAAGQRGATGAKGSRGSTGSVGSRGATGATGPAGTPGASGVQGPAGVGGRAYAVIDPAAVGSTATAAGLVSGQSSGFRFVRSPSTGVYCLTPVPGVDPGSEPATVSGEASYSSSGVVPLAVLNAKRSACSAGEFQVTTYDVRSPSSPAADVAFAIVAP